jgi:hypothetical protein
MPYYKSEQELMEDVIYGIHRDVRECNPERAKADVPPKVVRRWKIVIPERDAATASESDVDPADAWKEKGT